MSRNPARDILDQLAHEARHVLRTTVIDLDAFLALAGDDRAARWRQWDTAAKHQAVALMLERRFGDWTDEAIAYWIGRYDERWGQILTPDLPPATDPTAAELERLHDEHQRYAALASDERAADAAFHRRAATAYGRALAQFRAGVRPVRRADGAWVVPSSRAGAAPHVIRRLPGGVLECSCSARRAIHWPIALLIGAELGADALDKAA